MIERGELKAFRVGGKLLRIAAEEVEDYERRNGSL
jgi:excisionase family DNA binding protein